MHQPWNNGPSAAIVKIFPIPGGSRFAPRVSYYYNKHNT